MNIELKTKNILKLAWPAIISQPLITFLCLIDLFFANNLGINSIAAITIASSSLNGIYYFMEDYLGIYLVWLIGKDIKLLKSLLCTKKDFQVKLNLRV